MTLTTALQPVVRELVDNMRVRLTEDDEATARWKATHTALKDSQRTGSTWSDWQEDQLTQAAVGWVLTTVFVRFCEDNDLLGQNQRWISGVDADGRRRAVEEQDRFFSANLDQGFRGYLRHAFSQLERSPAAASLVGEHAGIHIAEPSDDAAQRLVEFWRQADSENATVWAFHDAELDTRFLGDMYQDLSEFAKKKYALLQTPEFVEEFILDRTLTRALAERQPRVPTADTEGRTGAVDFKVIDPTCGSGHFLLGAFGRLLDYWRAQAPGLEQSEHARLALSSIHGVDINPFAVAIAQFRLVVSALQSMGMSCLLHAPELPLQVYAGDSLLWSEDSVGQSGLGYGLEFDPDAIASGANLSTEDAEALRTTLARGQYDVVVGNPPYITVQDSTVKNRYKEIYSYCFDKWVLSVPFMEQFHALAKSGTKNPRLAGWIGQITARSFMAREFGAPLVEEFLSRIDLLEVVDTSEACIPGHETPTVTLVSRNRRPHSTEIRAVLSIQGEPETPTDPAKGLVWNSIVDGIDDPGFENNWISVVDLPRSTLNSHPWSLKGGGAAIVTDQINRAPSKILSEYSERIGYYGQTNADSAFITDRATVKRKALELDYTKELAVGDEVRNYRISGKNLVWHPYRPPNGLVPVETASNWHKFLYPCRTSIANRATFSKLPYHLDGKQWHEWHTVQDSSVWTPISISFAEVAAQNHFSLDRGRYIFKQTAPVIKLDKSSTIEDHFELLGILNSSTVCFWLRQNSHKKGGGATAHPWTHTYSFNCATVGNIPVPKSNLSSRSHRLNSLAMELSAAEPQALLENAQPSDELFTQGELTWNKIFQQMVAEQEELDWYVYHLYGITDTDMSLPVGVTPGIPPGERAFEIRLARSVNAGEFETTWFQSHRSTPKNEVPSHFPEDYRAIVHERLRRISENKSLELLEGPEYKRPWLTKPWDFRVRVALAAWILDRLENPDLWKDPNGYPQPQSIQQLAARIDTEPALAGISEALEMWSTKRQAGVLANLANLLKDEAVPHLAAYRLKDSGLRKFGEWQTTWDAQRAEDRGEMTTSQVPVPPNYRSEDFLKMSYWRARGKFDLPRERFILYPDASGPDDPTAMLGWAGWDHAEQGIALVSLYDERKDDTDPAQLIPLVAGLAELLPWIRQWHSEMDAHLGSSWADYLGGQLTSLAERSGTSIADLPHWRPTPPTRGRKRAATSTATKNKGS
ncbi:BREX-2 system adenine-specific DNA-methyltransferase PglX [Dietzia aurantiaca]|uniref:site-specific DNA-methyltransferase (adenine-specific) n=1 Tax=Dietzia aurantiaca TaxID=983873 RepID=A0ABV9PL09_9ACTN